MLQLIIDTIFNRTHWLWRRTRLRFDSIDRQLDEIRALIDPTTEANRIVEEMIVAEDARRAALDSLQQK